MVVYQRVFQENRYDPRLDKASCTSSSCAKERDGFGAGRRGIVLGATSSRAKHLSRSSVLRSFESPRKIMV